MMIHIVALVLAAMIRVASAALPVFHAVPVLYVCMGRPSILILVAVQVQQLGFCWEQRPGQRREEKASEEGERPKGCREWSEPALFTAGQR